MKLKAHWERNSVICLLSSIPYGHVCNQLHFPGHLHLHVIIRVIRCHTCQPIIQQSLDKSEPDFREMASHLQCLLYRCHSHFSPSSPQHINDHDLHQAQDFIIHSLMASSGLCAMRATVCCEICMSGEQYRLDLLGTIGYWHKHFLGC